METIVNIDLLNKDSRRQKQNSFYIEISKKYCEINKKRLAQEILL